MQDYNELEYEELKQLHVDIAQLLKDRKEEALEKLRGQMENLGFTVHDLVQKKLKPQKGSGGVKRYVNPDNPDEVYKGKGPKPQWLKDLLEEGREPEEFLVS